MDLTIADHGEVRLIAPGLARIDAAISVEFKEALYRATLSGPARIVLDLSGVSFLDSSGLGAVIAVMKAALPDRRLELSGCQGAVDKVMRLTRMDSVFVMHGSVEEALHGYRDAS